MHGTSSCILISKLLKLLKRFLLTFPSSEGLFDIQSLQLTTIGFRDSSYLLRRSGGSSTETRMVPIPPHENNPDEPESPIPPRTHQQTVENQATNLTPWSFT